MDTHSTVQIVLFLAFTRFLVTGACFDSTCDRTGPLIRFPFWLQNLQPEQCGYPGFRLSCDSSNMTVLELPNSAPLTVQAIDYATQELWLNDPSDCLPSRLLTLNLSGSPFAGVYYQDFTLFNCSFDYRVYRLNPIACLSGQNYTVFATSSAKALRFLASSSCSLIATIAVPVQWSYFEQVLSSDLSDNIRLTWGAPSCGKCESQGGRCRLKSNSSNKIDCQISPSHRLPKGARYAIIIGAGIPAFLFFNALVCFLLRRIRVCWRRGRPEVEFTLSVVAPPRPVMTTGLDEPTIASYPRTVLGESRRLPNPEHNVCPICLSEYQPKDTLRTIPDCQHCFHADCIDEWLRLNAACPVCRNFPKSSAPVHAL
ncbi:putative RING-H2 finger protein ATL21A [Ipomoea triloba]|uniref:putative RING-H2 finger protein ATL21A n=1 Tax=Ipomoea triloba TaxID=35885 RepID=UPI00125D1348|nr:putative RING-H2 finger protein ATL21A [Ipomoea triloba]